MASLARGLDAATILTPYAKTIADRGFTAVGRYLKSLTRAEIAALHAAGLGVWLIFETTADRALGGAAAGQADGAKALMQAKALGAPAGTVIYATVDTDPRQDQLRNIRDYFVGFDSAVGSQIGAYASGSVLLDLAANHPRPPAPWLAGAMGWSGSRAYEPSGAWAMKQGPQINAHNAANWAGLLWPALPFAYDPNVIARDIGAWLPAGSAPAAQPAPSSPSPAPAAPAADPRAVIRALQTVLRDASLYTGAIDGIWGMKSNEALAAATKAAFGSR